MTSTLQQEASRKLRFSAQTTMRRRPAPVRERLHHLHAHRLDDAVGVGAHRRARAGHVALRRRVRPAEPRRYERKVKNAQEAHEAIRPAGDRFRTPQDVRSELSPRRARALRADLDADDRVADEGRAGPDRLAPDRGATSSAGETVEFGASGTVITFRGFLAAYEEGRDDDRPAGGRRGAAPAEPRGGRRGRAARARAAGPRDEPAGALHRGDARADARGARHRPPVDLRVDHRHDPRPRLRLQEGHGARAGVPRVRRRRSCSSSTSAGSSTTTSPPGWRTTSTRSPPATSSASTGSAASTSATASGGLHELVSDLERDRRARDQLARDRRRDRAPRRPLRPVPGARTGSARASRRSSRPTS